MRLATRRRLKFSTPAHAALRRDVFIRDQFRCVRCGDSAISIPDSCDGRYTLKTGKILASGFHDVLVIDHVVTLRAGGANSIENFQTLCETCNKKKQKEDKEMVALHG